MGLLFPKPRPRKLEKADRLKQRISVDDRESAKVKARSGGRCEVWEEVMPLFVFDAKTMQQKPVSLMVTRCKRRAVHVHHRLGGIGVRGRGESAKAENKLHLCDKCHSDIHAHVLVPDGPHFRRVT